MLGNNFQTNLSSFQDKKFTSVHYIKCSHCVIRFENNSLETFQSVDKKVNVRSTLLCLIWSTTDELLQYERYIQSISIADGGSKGALAP